MSSQHNKQDREADEDEDPLINQQGCAKVYAKLEDCLVEHGRDWRACQKEVKAWKDCYDRAQATQQGQQGSGQAASPRPRAHA